MADPESARCALPKAEAPWWTPGAKRLEIRQQVLPAHAEFARLAVKAALSLRDGLAGGSISLDLEDGDYRRGTGTQPLDEQQMAGLCQAILAMASDQEREMMGLIEETPLRD